MAGLRIERRGWRSGRATVKLGSAAVALGVGAALITAPPAVGSERTFDAVASAYGVNNGISNPSFPLDLVLTGSGPVSSAHLTSLGGSDAFASFPYPGDTVVGLPGLASGVFGVSLPTYPFYVSTNAGDEARAVNYPGIALNSRSDDLVSEARALVGSEVSGLDSNSRIGIGGDGGVTSHASTMFKALQFGDVFTLSGVRSWAKVVADGSNGDLTRSSELSVGAIDVPGLEVDVPEQTPGTVPLPVPVPGLGQVPPLQFPPMPIPQGGRTLEAPSLGFTNGVFTAVLPGQEGQRYAIPSKAVMKALADRGITVTFQQAFETEYGVVAPAITFATELPAPPENPYLNGATHASYTLGGSFAEVVFDVSDAGSRPAVSALGSSPASGAGAAADGRLDAPASPSLVAAAVLPSTDSAAVGWTPGQSPLPIARPGNLVALRSPSLRASAEDIYLALIAVAVGVFTAGTGLRRLGVIRPWT